MTVNEAPTFASSPSGDNAGSALADFASAPQTAPAPARKAAGQPPSPQAAQEPTQAAASPDSPASRQSSERYRLRAANTLYGGVEISFDQGATWYLVARVIKPAVDRAPGAAASLPAVERSGVHGLAFAVGRGHLLRLLPDSPAAMHDPAAIVLNVAATASLFRDLLPPAGSPVQELVTGRAEPLPGDYTPRTDDRLLFTVTASTLSDERIAGLVKDAAERYRDAALARLRAAGHGPVSGFLTVNAAAAPGDKLDAVTYLLDGNVVAIQNASPFTLKLNTRDWANGEHLIEVRGLDETGSVVTQKKVLVVVDNS